MSILRPFTALRPPSGMAQAISSLPHDAVDVPEARTLAAGNPLSFLHVLRPEVDLHLNVPPHSEVAIARATENFQRLIGDVPFRSDLEPSLYLYRVNTNGVARMSVVGLVRLEDFRANTILRHETVRRQEVDDLARLTLALKAQIEPVVLFYPDRAEIDDRVRAASAHPPLYDFTAPDGVVHTLWRIEDSGPLVQAFSSVNRFYLAQGHQIVASVQRALSEGDGSLELEAHLLAALIPESQIQIHASGSVVKNLCGMRPEFFLEAIREVFGAEEGAPPSPLRPGLASMYLGGRWYSLDLRRKVQGVMVISSREESRSPVLVTEQTHQAPLGQMDAFLLQERILRPFLGINDPRTDPRIDSVSAGPIELSRQVDENKAAVAFSLYAPRLADVVAVAEAGQLMPPRSSWFEPRLRAGLLIYRMES